MASSWDTTTIRVALTQPKPVTLCGPMPSRNTKSGPDWPNISNDDISTWADFRLETLNESYGQVLDLEIPVTELSKAGVSRPDALEVVEITKPDEILYLIGLNDRVLQPTLGFAKRYLHLCDGVQLLHQVSAPKKALIPMVKISNGSNQFSVDHCVALDEIQSPNLVIGFCRPSNKFQSRAVAENSKDLKEERTLPLRQLANLCRVAGTRYGYIMTEKDFVACCFTKKSTEEKAQWWKVMMMPVPWTRQGASQLTTDLALWWLSMLALSAREHRVLTTEENMVGIGEWEPIYLDEQRGWVRRHRYSGFEQPMDARAQAPSPRIPVPAAFVTDEVELGIDPAAFDMFGGRGDGGDATGSNPGNWNDNTFNFGVFRFGQK
ncbi:hypothetical protein F4777DRAFT_556968 [Nemania sp. FL0916]|nr:hypothetical protein F4777DRAFT_556968 [Nemania sp. FL0916]